MRSIVPDYQTAGRRGGGRSDDVWMKNDDGCVVRIGWVEVQYQVVAAIDEEMSGVILKMKRSE